MSELVILGGGFAGVWAAMGAAAERYRHGSSAIKIVLLSKEGYLTIRPRLYEEISEDMRVPLAPLMQRIDVDFIQTTVKGIHPEKATIVSCDGTQYSYDRLILATGSQLAFPPIQGLEKCFNVDTWGAAQKLAEHYKTLAENPSFIVIGASFTGLEIATQLRSRFGKGVEIRLVDQNPNAAENLGVNPAPHIREALAVADIQLHFGRAVKKVTAENVHLEDGEILPADTVILASGLKASPLTQDVSSTLMPDGRLPVEENLQVIGSEKIYAAGDTGYARVDGEHATLMSCQHAMQLGIYAGHNAVSDLLGQKRFPYSQDVYRTCLDLGPYGALFSTGWERTVETTGADAKGIKEHIVRQLIYPPSPDTPVDEIFNQVSLVKVKSTLSEPDLDRGDVAAE